MLHRHAYLVYGFVIPYQTARTGRMRSTAHVKISSSPASTKQQVFMRTLQATTTITTITMAMTIMAITMVMTICSMDLKEESV